MTDAGSEALRRKWALTPFFKTAPQIELLDASLSRFTVENATADSFRMHDGMLEVRGSEGWLRSVERYEDFEIIAEFRFLSDDADSGLFIRTPGSVVFRRGWPTESYQIQIRNPLAGGPYPFTGGVFRHGRPHGETLYNDALSRASTRPTGDWQSLRVLARGVSLVTELNAVEITRAENLVAVPGHLGVQAEQGTLEFRSLALRPL